MDGLRHLLAAGRSGIDNAADSLLPRNWGSELVFLGIVGLFGFVSTLFVFAWGAMTLYLALLGEFSDVGAAGLTALAFLGLLTVLALTVKIKYGRAEEPPVRPATAAPQQAEAETNFNLLNIDGLIPQSRPMKAWDLATLVAVGVVTGLSNKK